jgi:hypothetical protein
MTAAVDALEAIGSARTMRYLLGAAFTMLHTLAEPAIRQLLAIPDEITIGVTMPVGRPAQPFRSIVRKPVAEVVHRDRW